VTGSRGADLVYLPRPMPTRKLKTALVHDWLVTVRGAERVLEVLAELLPDADLFCLVHEKGSLTPALEARRITPSFLQSFPFSTTKHRWYLPLMPTAIESLDLSSYDLIVSSSYCVAKGVITRPDARHVSYCHTPMRYVWEQYGEYFGPDRASPIVRAVAAAVTPWLRSWDVSSARRVDRYVANSAHVGRRIEKRYGLPHEVVFPPVECAKFEVPGDAGQGDYYVMLTALAPYKRVDLAIEAFERMGKRLLIGGGGQDEGKLRRAVKPGGPVELVGHVPREKMSAFLGRAKAFIFPGEEDFGIAPVEAMACGTPVIAFGRGGARESVRGLGEDGVDVPTGLFFGEQTVDSLIEAVTRFEQESAVFSRQAIRAHALTFDRPVFEQRMRAILDEERARLGG